MKELTSLLRKYEAIKNPKGLREKVAVLLSKLLNIPINEEHILLQKNILHIKGGAILRNEAFMKKEEIMKGLKEFSSELNISEVR